MPARLAIRMSKQVAEHNPALSVASVGESAQRVLAARFGGSPELSNPENLGGNGSSLVLRARVGHNDFLQERTVVVKQLPPQPSGEEPSSLADPEANRSRGSRRISFDRTGLFRELVAYQFTNTLAEESRPGPLLLAYDIQERLLILSDLGDGQNFAEVLTGLSAKDRRTALRKLGRSLGRMHVATAGKEESYNTLFRRQCQKHGYAFEDVVGQQPKIEETIILGLELMESNSISMHPEVIRLANLAASRQADATARAFTPFDLMPDNIVLAQRVFFLDYEWAGFRDIAFDVACVMAGFPQDLSTPALSDQETAEFLDAWRAEVVHYWPEFRDDGYFNEVLVATLIAWAFFSLALLYYGSDKVNDLREFDIEADDLKKLTTAQLIDLATTVDAILRFTAGLGEKRFAPVTELAENLLAALAPLGAHPQRRED